MTRPFVVIESSSELGGAELSLLPVIGGLAESREVIALLPGHGPLEDMIRAAGGVVSPGLQIGPALRRASRQYGSESPARMAGEAILQQATLTGTLAKLKPALVYCNGFRAQLAGTLPGVLVQAPVAWHVRDFVPQRGAGRVWSQLARRTTLVIANSSATASQPALAHHSHHPVVIWNGIDLGSFCQRAVEPTQPVIGMVGHLTPWKGHSRFLRVLDAVRKEIGNVEGRIAGGPIYETHDHNEYEGVLNAELRSLDLATRCTIDHINAADMPGWLSKLSVLVHCPDRPEPFGRAFVEAMAVGVPIVSASGDGSHEILDGVAITLPLRDEAAIVSSVVQLLRDPVRRQKLAALGRARAEERFDVRDYVGKVCGYLLSIARN